MLQTVVLRGIASEVYPVLVEGSLTCTFRNILNIG